MKLVCQTILRVLMENLNTSYQTANDYLKLLVNTSFIFEMTAIKVTI